MNLISNFIPIDKPLNKKKILLLIIQLIVLIFSKNVIDYKKRKILKLALNILLQDSKKWCTCERIKRSRKGSERTIDPRSIHSFAWRLLNPVVFQSLVARCQSAHRSHSQWRSRPRATLHFYRLSRPIKRWICSAVSYTFTIFRIFRERHTRNTFEHHLSLFLDRDVNQRLARPIFLSFPFRPYIIIHILYNGKRIRYLNLFYSKVWSSEIKYQIVDRL